LVTLVKNEYFLRRRGPCFFASCVRFTRSGNDRLNLSSPPTPLKENLKFRCNKSQITYLKELQSNYSLNFIHFIISINYAYFKNDITENQGKFGLKFFLTNDPTFVASEFKISFLQCILNSLCLRGFVIKHDFDRENLKVKVTRFILMGCSLALICYSVMGLSLRIVVQRAVISEDKQFVKTSIQYLLSAKASLMKG